jgi:hypothetical protein
MLSKRFYGAAMMGAIALVPMLTNCSDEDNPLCCSEFKAGATIDAKIGGNAQAQVAVQAVADFSGIASAAMDDLTTACRAMAEDLDADPAQRQAAEANADKQTRMKAWCSLAGSAIASVKAGGTLKIDFQPPACSASVSAKANCQAKCSGSAACDIKANPPKCTGGKLEVSCKGSCDVSASAPSIKCEGKCGGTCKGSCTASGGVAVNCEGKCDGTCAAGGSAGGSGIQADGSCKGTCQGTCTATATAPAVECSGSCQGECNASCTATPGSASVKCDGECKGDFEPLKCEGGKLEGGCTVEAKCDANCNASVSAKAECSPPQLTIVASGFADASAAAKLQGTLKANLGLVLAFRARLQGMFELTSTITGNADAVASIKTACIPQVIAAAVAAGTDVAASVEATGSIATSVGGS